MRGHTVGFWLKTLPGSALLRGRDPQHALRILASLRRSQQQRDRVCPPPTRTTQLAGGLQGTWKEHLSPAERHELTYQADVLQSDGGLLFHNLAQVSHCQLCDRRKIVAGRVRQPTRRRKA